MTFDELNNKIQIDAGTFTLEGSLFSTNELAHVLKTYNHDQPLLVHDAQKQVTTNEIQVTGTAAFLGMTTVAVLAKFAMDSQGHAYVILRFTLIGETAGDPPWKFSHSFSELPPFYNSVGAPLLGSSAFLDSLSLTRATFLLSTFTGNDPISPVPLTVGLHFVGNLKPKGLLGLFDTLLGDTNTVTLSGTIRPPEDNVSIPPVPEGKYPWETNNPPGIDLQASLDVEFQVGGLTINQLKYRIYTPLTKVWAAKNPSYETLMAMTGTLSVPSAGITLNVTAAISPDLTVVTFVGDFEGVSIQHLAQLSDLSHGASLLESLPQAIQTQLDQLSHLSLEQVGITASGSLVPTAVDIITVTVGFPGAHWTALDGIAVLSDLNTQFIVANPLSSADRHVDAMVAGNLKFAGGNFAASVLLPGFLIRAELQESDTIPLNHLFHSYLPELPAPPDLTIDEMVLGVTPGESYYIDAGMAEDTPWTLELGPVPLSIVSVHLDVNKTQGGSAQGSFSGTLLLSDALQMSITYNLPGSFVIRTEIPEVKLSQLIHLLSNIGLELPSGFDFTLKNSFVLIEESAGSLTFRAGTQVTDFGLLMFSVQKQSNWGFAFGMELSFEAMGHLPGLGILARFTEFVGLDDLLLVVSSIEVTDFHFPDTAQFDAPSLGTGNLTLPSQADGLVRGLNVYARLKEAKSQGLQTLAHYLGVRADGSVGITLSISLPNPSVNSKLFVSFTAEPFSDTHIQGELGVLLRGEEIGAFLSADLHTQVQGQPMEFNVTALVVPNGILISGTMEGTIHFDPVQLSNLAVVIGIDFEGIPSFGIAATIDIEDFDSSVAIFFDSINPADSMFAGAISNLTLGTIVETLAGQNNVPSELDSVLSQIGIRGLSAFTMPSSVATDLDQRNLAAISTAFQQHGSVHIPSTSDQLLLVANTEGSVWHLTDLSTMQHYTLQTEGDHIAVDLEAQIYVAPQKTSIGTLHFPQGFHVEAKIEFLILHARIKVNIALNKGIAIDVQIDPITLLSSNFFSVTGAHGQGGPTLSLSTYDQPEESNPKLRPPHFLLSGESRILSVDVLDVYIYINAHNVTFHITQRLSELVSFTVDGTISAFDKMSGSGQISVGFDKHVSLGELGTLHLDTTVSGTLDLSLNGTHAQAGVKGQFNFESVQFSVPRIALNVAEQGISNLADLVFDKVKDAIEAYLKNPEKWLHWLKNKAIGGLEHGAKDVGRVLKNVFHLADREIGNQVKHILGYGADGVAGALEGAGATADQAAALMHDLGFGPSQIGNALKQVFSNPHVDLSVGHLDTPAGPFIDTPAGPYHIPPHVDKHVPPHGDTSTHIDT